MTPNNDSKPSESQKATLGGTDLDQTLDLLQRRDPEALQQALRTLSTKKSKVIPRLIREAFFSECKPENALLIIEAMRQNPSTLSLEQLSTFLKNPAEEVRAKAFEAMEKTLYSCIYPEMFRSLLDSGKKGNKMQAYQFLGKLGRNAFLETLTTMFRSPNPEVSRLAGELCPSFLGNDLTAILDEHIRHSDPMTAALCQRALETLAERGVAEASAALCILKGNVGSERAPEPEMVDIGEQVRELILSFPNWLLGSLAMRDEEIGQLNPLQAMREVFSNIKEFLGFSFLCAYLEFGEHEPWLDMGCFRALQQTPRKCNTIQLLRAVSNVLPKPQSAQDLLPLILAQKIFADANDIFLEQILSFLEVFRLVDQNPHEAENLLRPALEGFGQFLDVVSPLRENHLIVRVLVNFQTRYYDFNTSPISAVEDDRLDDFNLEMHCPTLVSGDFSRTLNLSPFLVFDDAHSLVIKRTPGEQQLWDFLSRHNKMEGYMNSMLETYTDQQNAETYATQSF